MTRHTILLILLKTSAMSFGILQEVFRYCWEIPNPTLVPLVSERKLLRFFVGNIEHISTPSKQFDFRQDTLLKTTPCEISVYTCGIGTSKPTVSQQ